MGSVGAARWGVPALMQGNEQDPCQTDEVLGFHGLQGVGCKYFGGIGQARPPNVGKFRWMRDFGSRRAGAREGRSGFLMQVREVGGLGEEGPLTQLRLSPEEVRAEARNPLPQGARDCSLLIEERPHFARPARVLQLPQRLRLNLPNPLPRHRELLADFFQRVIGVHADAEAHSEHALFAGG